MPSHTASLFGVATYAFLRCYFTAAAGSRAGADARGRRSNASYARRPTSIAISAFDIFAEARRSPHWP